MHEVKIPTLGESVAEGVIVRWIKHDGDSVSVDEPLLELETDKASVEIPAPAAGVLRIDRGEGETVQVGDVVARIEAGASETQPAAAPKDANDSSPRESAAAGSDSPSSSSQSADAVVRRREDPASGLSPAVRRLVEENDLDPADIEGTGRSGRISKADVLRHIAERSSRSSDKVPALGHDRVPDESSGRGAGTPAETDEVTATTDSRPRSPTPYPTGPATEAAEHGGKRTPMSRLRRRIAERLLEAQRGAAILTTFNEVDMSAVLELRSRYRDAFEQRHGVRLGFMSFFAKACIAAIGDVPLINARIDGEDVVEPDSVNLGIAVGTPRGLVVPVVHNANRMSFGEIESDIARLAALAQENKLSIADLSGGTFTISNGGVYGSLLSTPILNPPQSGILGMHKVEKRPVVVDDEIVIRPMMYLALSYDHRLIDGAGAVTFLVRVKERIERPERLLLDL